jgi:uncharacterized protein YacL
MTRPSRTSPTALLVECVRLIVVAIATVGSYELVSSGWLAGVMDGAASDGLELALLVLGAATGYVIGGALGRFTLGRIEATEQRFTEVSSGELLAGAIGGLVGLVLGGALTWPVLLFEGWRFTLPLAAFVVLVLTATGVRVGANRGGDLLRILGASGRLSVRSPASGPRSRVVDTSALIDGRLVDVIRGGFLDGTLVIPRFVLYELQGLADAGDDERRRRGRRGLDVLGALQRSASVSLEVAERDYPEIEAVDAKLVAMALERRAPLVTVDGNLARVAEVQGVRVLNLHQLAEDLRPPVLPGDELDVRLVKPGKEAGQGVGYLSDGTMVVVEGGRDRVGAEVQVEVTSILSNTNGRMVFSTLLPAASEPAQLHASRGAAATEPA